MCADVVSVISAARLDGSREEARKSAASESGIGGASWMAGPGNRMYAPPPFTTVGGAKTHPTPSPLDCEDLLFNFLLSLKGCLRAQNDLFLSKIASGRDPEKGSKKSRPLGRAHPDLDEVVIRDETEVHDGRSAEGLDRVAVVTETNARE